MTEPWRLIADVGGTNVRFARSRADGLIRDSRSWPGQSFDSFGSALDAYLATLDEGASFHAAAIAAAGPVDGNGDGDAIELTNNDWRIEASVVAAQLGDNVAVRLLNDLEAVAFALPYLAGDQLEWITHGAPPSPPCSRMLAVNVGTGFGSAALHRNSGEWIGCPAESGHMRLVMQTADELALIAELGLADPTVEDVLSGHGIQRLYKAACALEPAEGASKSAFEFGSDDAASRTATRHFSRFLARAASDLVLASAAWDGLYLCGSVANAWSEHADFNEFHRVFRGQSKMRDRLGQTPVAMIRHDIPAFVGLANVAIHPH